MSVGFLGKSKRYASVARGFVSFVSFVSSASGCPSEVPVGGGSQLNLCQLCEVPPHAQVRAVPLGVIPFHRPYPPCLPQIVVEDGTGSQIINNPLTKYILLEILHDRQESPAGRRGRKVFDGMSVSSTVFSLNTSQVQRLAERRQRQERLIRVLRQTAFLGSFEAADTPGLVERCNLIKLIVAADEVLRSLINTPATRQ